MKNPKIHPTTEVRWLSFGFNRNYNKNKYHHRLQLTPFSSMKIV